MDGVKRDTLEGSDVIADLAIDIGDSLVLNSVTSYNEYSSFDRQDIDQLTLPIGQFEEFQDGDAFSQELRLSSTGDGPLEWIIGAFYLKDHLERQVEFQLGPDAILLGVGLNGDTGRFNGKLDTTSFSIFGNVGYDFTDRLKLGAGLRWIDEEKKGEKVNSAYNGAGPASPVFLNGGFAAIFEPSDSGRDELSTDAFTYSLSLQYDLTDDLMLYGSHSRGFKSGGFNIVWGPIGPGEDGFEFDDETVYAYELGLKGTAADGAVQFSTAAFYQKHENYQTAAFIGTIFNLSNADQASTRGVEAELTWQVLDSLRLGANLAFIDAKYDNFKNGPCNALSTPDANGFCDQSGDQLPFVSDWTANLSAEYVQPLMSGNLRLRADLALADDYNPDLVLAPYYVQDGYERLNLRAGWESERFDVTGFVNNVTDAEIVDWAGAANVVPGASGQYVIQAGRTYGLTLRLKF
jgi:outer membrane receptor protein involved in Fe transport